MLFFAICVFSALIFVLTLVLKRMKGSKFYTKLVELRQKLFWAFLIKSYQAAFLAKMLQTFTTFAIS